MTKKRMSSAVRKAVSDHALAQKGGERLTDSITGSLRIEGYNVKREDVAQIVMTRMTSAEMPSTENPSMETTSPENTSAEAVSERQTDE